MSPLALLAALLELPLAHHPIVEALPFVAAPLTIAAGLVVLVIRERRNEERERR